MQHITKFNFCEVNGNNRSRNTSQRVDVEIALRAVESFRFELEHLLMFKQH